MKECTDIKSEGAVTEWLHNENAGSDQKKVVSSQDLMKQMTCSRVWYS